MNYFLTTTIATLILAGCAFCKTLAPERHLNMNIDVPSKSSFEKQKTKKN